MKDLKEVCFDNGNKKCYIQHENYDKFFQIDARRDSDGEVSRTVGHHRHGNVLSRIFKGIIVGVGIHFPLIVSASSF